MRPLPPTRRLLTVLVLLGTTCVVDAATSLDIQISFTVTPPPVQARPRVVSDAPTEAVEAQAFRHEVVVNVSELIGQGGSGRGPLAPFDLSFAISGAAGLTITKTGATTARVDWASPTPPGHQCRATITVTDTVSGHTDTQSFLVVVRPTPGAGN